METDARSRSPLPYSDLADRIDECVAIVFELSDRGKIRAEPINRFRVLQFLLTAFGTYAPGLSLAAARRELLELLHDSHARSSAETALNEIESIAREVQNALSSSNLSFTYCAASYWSPIDHMRHTLTRRQLLQPDEDERTIIAYAYAFYALTFYGRDHGPYSSIIQYIVEKAPGKRPINVIFKGDTTSQSTDDWFVFPDKFQDAILDESGLSGAVQAAFLSDAACTLKSLQGHLARALARMKSDPWTDWRGFAATYIQQFPSHAQRVSEPIRKLAGEFKAYLEQRLQIEDRATRQVRRPQIDDNQALFMLLTHFIYRKACPADYIYMAVVKTAKSHCTMTIGTSRMPSPAEQGFLHQVARSLLFNPLMLDLNYLEGRQIQFEASEKVLREVSHTLETPFLDARRVFRTKIDTWQTDRDLSAHVADLRRVESVMARMCHLITGAKMSLRAHRELCEGTTDLRSIVCEYASDIVLLERGVAISEPVIDGIPRPVKGKEEVWGLVVWSLLHNAVANSPPSSIEPVHLFLRYAPLDTTFMRVPKATLVVSNHVKEPVSPKLVEQINRALNAEIDQIAPELIQVRDHGIGLAIVGKFLRAISATGKAAFSDGVFTLTISEVTISDA